MTATLRAKLLAGIVVAFSLGGCSSESLSDACLQGPLFSNARTRAERAVAELDRTTSIELEEAVLAMVDQVSVMREVSPRSLRDPLGVALAAYGQLVVALEQLGWDPVVAATDTQVESARRAFTDTSVSQALLQIEDFLDEQCEQARSASNPNFALTGTTLANPTISEEPSTDANENDAPSDTELVALGFAIGEAYGVALTDAEAQCVARDLGVTFADGTDVDVEDQAFFDFVKSSFVSCGVTTPPVTIPNN